MIRATIAPTFDAWQSRALALLAAGVPPAHVVWSPAAAQLSLPGLFADAAGAGGPAPGPRLPRRFAALARSVAHHASDRRWDRLYRVLWRLVHEDPRLLDVELDDDVAVLRAMERQVRREVHRLKAFVRFRKISVNHVDTFVAWYRPEHPVLPLAAPFFADRFRTMAWSILTPDGSAHRDGERLVLDERPIAQAPAGEDEIEALWRTYYEAASNPARLNLRAMRRDMPRRLWTRLPETRALPGLVAGAAPRVQAMLRRTRAGARPLVPPAATLDQLRAAAAACDACDLARCGSRVVFGEGPPDARIALVGEQPGDGEDRAGRPFVGPAGEVLDAALAAAGVDRRRVYVTNAVKHFRFVMRGKRRIHQSARMSEIADCRPWLEAELAALEPGTVVALGATATRSLLGPGARVGALRGRVLESRWAPRLVVTLHPSAVLRTADAGARAELFRALVADLRLAAGGDEAAALGGTELVRRPAIS